jgi:D-methionine transport system substrate-binding protein
MKSWNRIGFVVVGFLMGIVGFAGGGGEATNKLIKIGANPVPHGEILAVVAQELEQDGIRLEIIEFGDYVTPNLALADGQLDANFFQHGSYLRSFADSRNLNLVSLVEVHVELMGLYSRRLQEPAQIPPGAVVALPSEPTNEGRALLLLETGGLITLRHGTGVGATLADIQENPLNLRFRSLEASQLPRIMADVDAVVINGNFALGAGLNPLRDAILVEDADSPYGNVVAIRAGEEDDPRFKALTAALQSDRVREFILQNYGGAVIPRF